MQANCRHTERCSVSCAYVRTKQAPKVPQFIVTVLAGIRKHIPRFFSYFLDEMQIVTREPFFFTDQNDILHQ